MDTQGFLDSINGKMVKFVTSKKYFGMITLLFRPWYVGTINTLEGKDVVIVIDFTTHMKDMEENLRAISKHLLKMIDAKDRVRFYVQEQKEKIFTFMAAVPAYCRLIASPLFAQILLNIRLHECGNVSSGNSLPSLRSYI